jgi:DNA replication protein DnaC
MDRSLEQHVDKMRRMSDAWVAFNGNERGLKEPLGDKTVECEKHGPYQSAGVRYMGTREVWTRCPACEEQKLADDRQAQAQKQAEMERKRMEYLIGEAAIPPRFIGRTLDSFKATTDAQRAAHAVAVEFAQNFEQHAKRGSGLILSGLPGTGKSHLAIAILQALLPEICGRYTTCMGVIRSVRNTWRKDSEHSETQILRAYADVPLLVLDEIGAQYGTDGEQTILFDVLDMRYREMQPTIFLTNQNQKGLAEFVGERTFDRMRETCKWVAFDWPSYRPQARKEAA